MSTALGKYFSVGFVMNTAPTIPPLRTVLRDNVTALLRHSGHHKAGKVVWHALVTEYGIANGTAQRIKAAETSVGIEVLEDLAKAFRLQPWQLLVPSLDPTNMPVIGMTETERRLYAKLKDDLQRIAGQIR